MPNESRLLALRNDLVDTLKAVSRAEGYWYDYGGVSPCTVADWETEKDYDAPTLHVMWEGPVDATDARHGFEAEQGSAPNRFRRYEQFTVSVAFKHKEDPELVAWRIESDLHKAIIGQSNRHRSGTRVNTFDVGREWFPIAEGTQIIGGMLAVTFTIRWDHLTGDMSSQ